MNMQIICGGLFRNTGNINFWFSNSKALKYIARNIKTICILVCHMILYSINLYSFRFVRKNVQSRFFTIQLWKIMLLQILYAKI